MREELTIVGHTSNAGCMFEVLAILADLKDVKIVSVNRGKDHETSSIEDTNFDIVCTHEVPDVKWLSGPTRQALEGMAISSVATTLSEMYTESEIACEGLEVKGIIDWSDDELFRYFEDSMDFPGWEENEWSQPLVKALAEFAEHNILTHKPKDYKVSK